MKLKNCLTPIPFNPARRRFIQGIAGGGVLLGLSPWMKSSWALPNAAMTGAVPHLRGTEFDLTLTEAVVNYTGNPRMAMTINGSIPGPVLHWREGDDITLRVTNQMNVSSSIHWHGMILPYQMDGVPGISYRGIAPGETFTYRFKVQQAGTYWYHSHTHFQEQVGMYGAIIIEPRDGEHIRADRDYVVQLSDWTDTDPLTVFAKLKKQSDYYNFIEPTAVDFFHDVSKHGLGKAMDKRRMWNNMRMSPMDLADISAYTYTYLMNGTSPTGNWTGLFKPGERVRLRFICSSAQSFFDVRIPGLKMTVVQVDGQDVEPVTIDEFRCGPGETYDVVVTPKDDAYTIFAQSMDRSGFARGTLAVRAGLNAPVPALDKPQPLTMIDMMGMDMDSMDMSGMVDVHHAKTEYGPSVDMRVDMPRTNLDDPGIGLRNNGRRVLTYADLHTPGGPLDPREAQRDIELHLTGNMERFTWSFDGVEFGGSTPVHFRHGERLRVILHNDTMMTHPMHMHGMWSEQQNAKGEFQVRRHTISVQPAQYVSFLVNADAVGRWAWHCHLLYHMEAGMFREVVVS